MLQKIVDIGVKSLYPSSLARQITFSAKKSNGPTNIK